MSSLETAFARQLEHRATPTTPRPQRDFAFAADLGRKLEFDFAWAMRKIAVEIQGSPRGGGRAHASYAGLQDDAAKANLAQALNWRVFAFTAVDVQTTWAAAFVTAILADVDVDRPELFSRPTNDDALRAAARRLDEAAATA